MHRLRQAAITRLTRWSSRRHGVDSLPMTVDRRRIYIIPSRFGLSMALLIGAMLLAGLNYNSNLGLAFGFLVASVALVAMHHCHRNLQGLIVDASTTVETFAGTHARLGFTLRNTARVERSDIEIRCALSLGASDHGAGSATLSVPAGAHQHAVVSLPVGTRGVLRVGRVEIRSRYPFGWFRAWTYVQHPLRVIVAPQPRGERRVPASTPSAGREAQAGAPGDEDFAGSRPYESGMPLKHMVWRVLARGAEPAVRIFSGAAGRPEWLDWTMLAPLASEARLSQLCRWILECEAAGRPYGLRLPQVEIKPGGGAPHRTACLRALAEFPKDESSRPGSPGETPA